MISHTCQKLIKAFKISALCLLLVMLPFDRGLAQETQADVSYYISQLKNSKNSKTRADAAYALQRLEVFTEPVVFALIKALDDSNKDVRINAASALGTAGSNAKVAIPALIAKLKDQNEWVRANAADALGVIGSKSEIAIPYLTRCLSDPSIFVRSSAVTALGSIDLNAKAVSKLLFMLKDQHPAVRFDTATALGTIGSEEKKRVIPRLIAALSDQHPHIRAGAAHALGKISFIPEAKKAIPKLIAMLKDGNSRVRSATILALASFGSDAQLAVDELIEALKDKDSLIRGYAAYALGEIGSYSKGAVPKLITALEDSDPLVRGYAAGALGGIGLDAEQGVDELIAALKDPESKVRSQAAFALGEIRAEPKKAIPKLIDALEDKDAQVRSQAAFALGEFGSNAQESVDELLRELRDQEADVRNGAAFALGEIHFNSEKVVPVLIEALADRKNYVRSQAAFALGEFGSEAKKAIPELMAALRDKDRDIRSGAAYSLGLIGSDAKAVIPELIKSLTEKDLIIRSSAANALGKISEGLQEKSDKLSDAELAQVIVDLEKAFKALEDEKARFDRYQKAPVHRSLNALKAEQDSRLSLQAIKQVQQNPWLLGIITTPILYLGVLWLRPRWLLLLPSEFAIPKTGISFSPDIVRRLKYRPRVLDAWISEHLDTARKRFEKKTTVQERTIHIPAPVIFEGKTLSDLIGKDVRSTFSEERRCCLLIWGEGGAGKTSLACQLAKWAMVENKADRLCQHHMLPVLIEQELDFKVADGKQPLKEAIRGQLQTLIKAVDPVSDELLDHLLRNRRVLVIVDHLSEMSDATRKEIRPGHPDFSVNALIVTSRLEESLDKVPKTTIKPLRIEGNRLSSFMEAYLTRRGKRDLFTDSEYFDACSRLSRMVGQHNDVTVLLAKLYAEQMIAQKEGEIEENLPENIPDLMLSYLNELNRGTTEGESSNRAIHRDAKIIAWECLQQTYHPSPTNRETALTALAGSDAETRLQYLETKLRVIQTIGSAQDQIQFALDPLAEYLAALHLVDEYRNDGDRWQSFLASTDRFSPVVIQGFLLALRECCLVPRYQTETPAFVVDALEQKIGISSSQKRATVMAR